MAVENTSLLEIFNMMTSIYADWHVFMHGFLLLLFIIYSVVLFIINTWFFNNTVPMGKNKLVILTIHSVIFKSCRSQNIFIKKVNTF